jgi:Major Facilitator Superfamily
VTAAGKGEPGTARQAWSPLGRPDRPIPRAQLVLPFARLARTNAASAAGDALVAIALAGSLFFDTSPNAARGRVALYLLFTMAPFAIVAPLVGPLLDRVVGARRAVVLTTGIARCLACVLMVGNLKSNWLFPLAFVQLVLSKTYAVSKSSLVPTVVRSESELVEANAKLGLASAAAGFAVAPIAVLFRKLFNGGSGVMVLAALAFGLMAVLALKLERTGAATLASAITLEDDDSEADRVRVRSAGITLAASAMAFLRACVGFLSFHLAFWFRTKDLVALWFGLALAASALGSVAGNVVAPRIRQRTREEWMLTGSLALVGLAGVFAAVQGGRAGAIALALFVGLGGSVGRLAFDAIVQRDANDENRGQAFAQFETRFQLAWVLAAFVPVVVKVPGWTGFAAVGALGVFALVSYAIGSRFVRRHGRAPTKLSSRAVRGIRTRRANELGRSSRKLPKGAPLPPPRPPDIWPPDSWPKR